MAEANSAAEAAAEAVIFDLGGVVLDSPFLAIAAYEAERGVRPGTVNSVIAAAGEGGAFARMERGEISVEGFAAPFASEATEAGHPELDGRVLMDAILRSVAPRPLMLDALAALREEPGRLRTAALTNNFRAESGRDGLSDSLAQVRPLFDVVVESAVEGVRKPDPAIYRAACERLGVPPARCVFLDDIGRNLKPARAMGMRTIKVDLDDRSGARALGALARILGTGAAAGRIRRALRRGAASL